MQVYVEARGQLAVVSFCVGQGDWTHYQAQQQQVPSLTKLFHQPQKILFMIICYTNIFLWVSFLLVKTCLEHIAKAMCSDHVFAEEVLLLLLIYLH